MSDAAVARKLLRAVGKGSTAVGKWLLNELEAIPEERRRYAVQAVGYLMGGISAAKLAEWLRGESDKRWRPRDAEMFAPTVRRVPIVADTVDELVAKLEANGVTLRDATLLVLPNESEDE